MSDFNWQFTDIIICLLISGSSFYLARAAFKRKGVPGARWFAAMGLAAGWITLCYALEAGAGSDLNAYISFSKIEYVALTTIPVLWLGVALAFSASRTLSRRQTIALLVIPAAAIVLAWTNEWHGLIWKTPRFDMISQPPIFAPSYGPGFWIYVIYSYLVYFAGSILLIRMALRSWNLYRAQSALILVGTSIPWLGNLFEIFDITPVPGLYLHAIFLGISLISLAFGLLRLHLLDIMPLAHGLVFNNIPNGIVVVDRHDRIVAVNPRVLEFLGGSKVDPIGKPLEVVFSKYASDVEALRGVVNRTFVREFDDRTVEINISPVLDSQQAIRGRLFILSDITERAMLAEAQRQIYEQVSSQADELNRRIESLTIAQWMYREIGLSFNEDYILEIALDAGMRMAMADGAFVALVQEGSLRVTRKYGEYSDEVLESLLEMRSGLLGQAIAQERPVMATEQDKFTSAMAGARAQMVLPLYMLDASSKHSLAGVLVLETKRPERFTEDRFQLLELLADRVAAAAENARLLATVKAHAEQQERLYQQVSRLEQMKSDMIRIAAHDLKNPLSVVTGYVSLMLDDDGTSQVSRYRLMIEAMRRASHRMVQIIDDILSLERIERMSNNPQHLFDIRATVEQAAAEYIERAAQKRQEFLMEMVEGELMVRGDPAQIREAATNFMSNAIKYTPDGGHIVVRLVHDASSVRFEVQDTGFGIPEAMQERLFQPFYRARTDETLAIEGTGLGLHLVKNIIDRHSGSIIFQSVYGEGSTFGFRLPEAVAALNMDVTQEIPRASDSKAAEVS